MGVIGKVLLIMMFISKHSQIFGLLENGWNKTAQSPLCLHLYLSYVNAAGFSMTYRIWG